MLIKCLKSSTLSAHQAPRPLVKVLEAIERTVVDQREPGLLRNSETSHRCAHKVEDTWARQEDSEEAHFSGHVLLVCGPELVRRRIQLVARPGTVRARLPVAFYGTQPRRYQGSRNELRCRPRDHDETSQRACRKRPAAFRTCSLCVLDSSLSPFVHGYLLCSTGSRKGRTKRSGQVAQNRSDTYVRLQRTLVQKLQLLVVSVIRGRDDIGGVLGEGESLQELESFLETRGVDRGVIKKQLTRLDKTASPGLAPPQVLEAMPLQSQVEAREEEMVQLGPVPEEEIHVVVRRQPGRQACANMKESRTQAVKEVPDGFCVCEAGRSTAKRLHRLGICWMVPGVWTTLCIRTRDHSCLGNTSTMKCASAAAPLCSHKCHKTVAQTRIHPRTSTEVRPPHPPSLSSFRLLLFSALRLRSSLCLFVSRASALSQLLAMIK